MRASAESLHGHQVNRKLSLSPTTCCRDEEQCFWSAALSHRGVPLAPRSIVQTSRRCSSTVSPCRLVLIGTSEKYRPLTFSERLEYVLHRTSNPPGFQNGRAFSSSDLRAYPLLSRTGSPKPSDCRKVVSKHRNRVPLRFWAVLY